MKYRIDALSLRDGTLVIEGWAMGEDKNPVAVTMTDRKGEPIRYTAVQRDRADVFQQFGADRMCGFTAAAPWDRDSDGYLVLSDGKTTRRVRVNEGKVKSKNSVRTKRAEKLLALVHFETLVVCWDFMRENGIRALWKKAVHKIKKIDEDYDYPEWEARTRITEEELSAQRAARPAFEKKPLISVVIPAYNTPENYLRMLYDSFLAQTYPNIEVIIADGSDKTDIVKKVTEEYEQKTAPAAKDGVSGTTGSPASTPETEALPDFRVTFRYVDLGGNFGFSGNTNRGIEAAAGEYIALCDHDDELPPTAMFHVVEAINAHPAAQFIYTDEDKIDFDGEAVFEPHFKSDYNPDLLTSVNYICHLSVIRRDLMEKVGGFRKEFDGAQDHDFFLRCLEIATEEESKKLAQYRDLVTSAAKNEAGGAAALTDSVSAEKTGFPESAVRALREGRFTSETVIHVPKICYHWRYHKGSTAENPESKLYAFDAGARAVKAHYERTGIRAKDVVKGVTYGYYHTLFDAPENVKVSVIIPNKDHIDDLDKCIRSMAVHSTFRNLEFIVVENNSTDPETFSYYEKIDGHPEFFAGETVPATAHRAAASSPAGKDGSRNASITVKVVKWEREFNYSAINNFGVQFASGEVLMLLNNDTELMAPDSVTEMLAYALREDTGIVGARLNYGDDTIQHAGVIVGLGGIAGAAFVGLHEKENSYMHRMMCVQDLSAVTAACIMMRKEVFEKVQGFAEDLAVAFNDIDLCMKVRAAGYRVVYDPYAVWHHYESKSRGLEDTPEKVIRFNNEVALFATRWDGILQSGDPYYNPNLTLRKANFALRDLTKEKIGEPYKLEFDVEAQLRTVRQEKERRGL